VGCCSEDDDNSEGDAAATAAAEMAAGMMHSLLFSHWFVSSVMWSSRSRLGLGMSVEFPDSKSIVFMVEPDADVSSQECSFIILSDLEVGNVAFFFGRSMMASWL